MQDERKRVRIQDNRHDPVGWLRKVDKCGHDIAISDDPDQAAHYEQPDLDLQCLHCCCLVPMLTKIISFLSKS